MNIALSPEQEQFIQSQIDRGRFKSADEAVSQAFKLLEDREREYQNWIEETRQKVDVAIAELDRGEGVDGPTAMDRYLQKFQTARQTLPS
jgi:antitoxin ParD1/3/4